MPHSTPFREHGFTAFLKINNGIVGDSDGNHGDRAGISVHAGGDFNGDGYADLAIGAAGADDGVGDRDLVGESYILFGRGPDEPAFPPSLELDSLDGSNGITVRGTDAEDYVGSHVAVGDVNGDAIADLIMSSGFASPDGRTHAGKTHVVFGAHSTPPAIDLAAVVDGDGQDGFVIHGIEPDDYAGGDYLHGRGVDIGDFNNDGIQDVVVGASGAGEAYMVFGGPNILPPPPTPSLSINDVSVNEGDSATITVQFTVTRSGDSTQAVTVDYATADGTALAGSDYAPIDTSMLTFDPGVTSQTIDVTVYGDTDSETDESFYVILSNISAGATIADGEGTGTIVDDDGIQTSIYVSDIAGETRQRGKHMDARLIVDLNLDTDGIASEGDAGAANVQVTLRLTDSAGNAVGPNDGLITGYTDSAGVFRSDWIRGLDSGDYRIDLVDAVFDETLFWNHLLDQEDDSNDDDDNLLDDWFTV